MGIGGIVFSFAALLFYSLSSAERLGGAAQLNGVASASARNAPPRRGVLLTPHSMLRFNGGRLPADGFVAVQDDDAIIELSKKFDDYGHMRFGKREEFDDYGHLRFGRSDSD